MSPTMNPIRVLARIRPMSETEYGRGCQVAVTPHWGALTNRTPTKQQNVLGDKTPLVSNTARIKEDDEKEKKDVSCKLQNKNCTSVMVKTNSTERTFEVDTVLGPWATQQDVYNESIGEAVRRNIIRGYHTTIIAYGQTCSGKTYTMSGPSTVEETTENPELDQEGIIPRAMNDLFQAKERMSSKVDVKVSLTYMEIYNDDIRDLLSEESLALKLRDSGDDVIVIGLSSIEVSCTQEATVLMQEALTRRASACTNMNERSSRSHAICTFTVTTKARGNPRERAVMDATTAKLTLVDLAGSERIKESGVEGIQQQESISINKDLFVLGKVVAAMSEQSRNAEKVKHVPYRDSKLTRILRDSLGGNCFTVLIACVSPADVNVEESINTLRYAERSKSITNALEKNVLKLAMSPEASHALRTENRRLKARVVQLEKRLLSQVTEFGEKNNHNIGSEPHLLNLQEKVKAAREKSRSAISTVGRWEERVERLKAKASKARMNLNDGQSVLSSCLSYELQDTFDESSISVISTSESFDCISSYVVLSPLEDEVKQLKIQRDSLKEELIELDQSIEQKRLDRLKLEMSFQPQETTEESRQNATDQTTPRASQLQSPTENKATSNVILKRLREAENRLQNEAKLRLEAEEKVCGLEREIQELKKCYETDDAEIDSIVKDILGESFDHLPGIEGCSQNTETWNEDNGKDENEAHCFVPCDDLVVEMSPMALEKSAQHSIATIDAAEIQINLTDVATQENKSERKGVDEIVGILSQNDLGKAPHQSPLSDGQHESSVSLFEETLTSESNDRMSATPNTNANHGNDVTPDIKEYANIRSHAEKMVLLAEKSIKRKRGSAHSVCSSVASSVQTQFKKELDQSQNTGVHISNIERVDVCNCEHSALSGNCERNEFYLPQVGVACSCGRKQALPDDVDPCELSCILRNWQVTFLASVGIRDGYDLIHAYKERPRELAKLLKQWRKAKGLSSAKTSSCSIALHIWSRTCKSVIKSVREQQANGIVKPHRPHFLDITVSDDRTVSTVGLASVQEQK